MQTAPRACPVGGEKRVPSLVSARERGSRGDGAGLDRWSMPGLQWAPLGEKALCRGVAGSGVPVPIVLNGAGLGHRSAPGRPSLQVLGLQLLQLPQLCLQPLPVGGPQLLQLLHGKGVHVAEGDVRQLPGRSTQSAHAWCPLRLCFWDFPTPLHHRGPGPALGERDFQAGNGEEAPFHPGRTAPQGEGHHQAEGHRAHRRVGQVGFLEEVTGAEF